MTSQEWAFPFPNSLISPDFFWWTDQLISDIRHLTPSSKNILRCRRSSWSITPLILLLILTHISERQVQINVRFWETRFILVTCWQSDVSKWLGPDGGLISLKYMEELLSSIIEFQFLSQSKSNSSPSQVWIWNCH